MRKIALISTITLVTLSAFAGKNMQFNRSLNLSADRLSAVEFDVGAGSLEIVGTSGDEIKINATIESDDFRDMENLVEYFENKMKFSIERQSEYAMVYAKSKESFNWGKSKNVMIHLQVELPKDMDLEVDDGSGSMTIENIGGMVAIDDGSGTITLRNIANDVEVEDGSGSLFMDNIQGDVSIEDGSGTIELKRISGSVTVEDGSGGIHATDVGGNFRVDDGSGEIEVKQLHGRFKLVDDGSGSVYVNGEKWDKK